MQVELALSWSGGQVGTCQTVTRWVPECPQKHRGHGGLGVAYARVGEIDGEDCVLWVRTIDCGGPVLRRRRNGPTRVRGTTPKDCQLDFTRLLS